MSQLTLLVDNDIVIKLAKMDCMDDALASIDRKVTELGSLGFMLRYMGKTSEAKRLQLAGNQVAADRLNEVLQRIKEIEPTPAQQQRAALILQQALLAELDLDAGEVGLMAVGVDVAEVEFATGDKRALRSLPRISQMESSLLALKKRIICLEQIIRKLCDRFGLQRVRRAVAASPRADEVVSSVYDQFGSDSGLFCRMLDLVVAEHVEKPAPGWLKKL